MNWYRLRVELFAWAWKTVWCVMAVWSIGVVAAVYRPRIDMVYWTEWERLIREHPWTAPALLGGLLLAILGLCLESTRQMRRSRRYGER